MIIQPYIAYLENDDIIEIHETEEILSVDDHAPLKSTLEGISNSIKDNLEFSENMVIMFSIVNETLH